MKLQKDKRSGIYFKIGISIERIEPEVAHVLSGKVIFNSFKVVVASRL